MAAANERHRIWLHHQKYIEIKCMHGFTTFTNEIYTMSQITDNDEYSGDSHNEGAGSEKSRSNLSMTFHGYTYSLHRCVVLLCRSPHSRYAEPHIYSTVSIITVMVISLKCYLLIKALCYVIRFSFKTGGWGLQVRLG